MIRAVICDDEIATQTIIKHFLIEESLPVEIAGIASNGKEAVNLIKTEQPQLVFLDINMPMLSGFEVIEQIRGVSSAKIIIITAFASFQNARQALQLGVSDILPKPIDFEQLKNAIIAAIGWQFTTNTTVNQMLEYIHAHYKENIELTDLANLTFCTESHISRLFKKYTEHTVLSYIHQLRIEEACRMLTEQKTDIQETAEYVGYASLNNFYKYFKRYTGKTPAQYTE